ncbi:hypothetical protein [Salinibacter ruber]|uniref:hypothetical protein n=1 Tax=Salinibacter ruber TaxID=146919 RepID=UPI00216A0FEC|nr:hypothetical protein [Salinibacter ruber]MCS3703727.1 hypothetical protein [Salinibacter ruber]
MMEILRDPFWRFVGVALTLLGVGVTVAIYFLRRRKKRLAYEIVSSSSLLSMRDELGRKLEINYGGYEVKNVHLINLRIYNSGTVPIESGDFERCISIDFGGRSRVLSSEIKDTNPKNLEIEYDTNEDTITFDPVLLNSEDSFSVKALVSDYQSELDVDARIVGVSSIQRGPEGQITTLAIMAVGMLLSLAGVGMSIYSGEAYNTKELLYRKIQLISNITISVGYVTALVAMFKNDRFRNLFNEMKEYFHSISV